jgi:chromate transporter
VIPSSATTTSDISDRRRPASPAEIFRVFTLLALQGFGGVIVVAQRVLCEEQRWLTPSEFVELLSVGQVVPGPNICNVALIFGDRHFGWRGAFAAITGLVTAPLILVVALTAAYAHWAGVPAVGGAVRGMGAAAAGMIAGVAIKLASALRKNPLGLPVASAIGVAAFLLVAILRVPLPWALATTGSVAWLLAMRRHPGARGPR